MNGRNEENLKELFEKFLGPEQAEQAVKDIDKAEQILREHPAPEPSAALIGDIKAEVREAVLRGKADVFRMREMFERIPGSEQAVEDIDKAEQILREHPAPEPSAALIADIKAEVREAVLRGEADEDIQEGEEILREYPAPEPSAALIADIKAEIGERLLGRKRISWRRVVYETAAVAAAVIILAVVSVKLFERPSDEPGRVVYASIIPTAIWESDDIASDDTALAMLTAEIEQIEEEALALRLGGDVGNGERVIAELEMELIEINSDFWKG